MRVFEILALLCSLVLTVNGSVDIFEVIAITNGAIVQMNVSTIKNKDNLGTFNMDLELLKDFDGKIMMTVDIAKQTKDQSSFKTLLAVPKINFCDISNKKLENPLIEFVLNQVMKYGSIPRSCPVKMGNYHLKNVVLPDIAMPAAMFPSGDYRTIIKFTDDAAANPMIFTVTVHSTLDHSSNSAGKALGGILG